MPEQQSAVTLGQLSPDITLKQLQEALGTNPKQATTPLLITMKPGESFTEYYQRAETQKIGRKCSKCGHERRFSLVTCPACGEKQHEHCHFTLSEDEAAITATVHNPSQQSGNGNFEFTPNENYDPNSGKPNNKDINSDELLNRAAPMDQWTKDELIRYAGLKEIDLGTTNPTGLKKADLIDKIESA